MPNVSLTTCSVRGLCNLLLALCLAFAVSNLFSVLPFGNASSGYMPPVPAPVVQTVDPAPSLQAVEAALQSDDLSWEDTCQVIWGAVNDLTNPIDGWATADATRYWLTAVAMAPLAASSLRIPPRPPALRYFLRAPPRLA